MDVLVRSSSTEGVGEADLGVVEIASTALSFLNRVALGGDDNFSVDDEGLQSVQPERVNVLSKVNMK